MIQELIIDQKLWYACHDLLQKQKQQALIISPIQVAFSKVSFKELNQNEAKIGSKWSEMDAVEEKARERWNIFIIFKVMRSSDLIYKKQIIQV